MDRVQKKSDDEKLCDRFDVGSVSEYYSERGDFFNITNRNLFQKIVSRRIQEKVEAKIGTTELESLVNAKWREFLVLRSRRKRKNNAEQESDNDSDGETMPYTYSCDEQDTSLSSGDVDSLQSDTDEKEEDPANNSNAASEGSCVTTQSVNSDTSDVSADTDLSGCNDETLSSPVVSGATPEPVDKQSDDYLSTMNNNRKRKLPGGQNSINSKPGYTVLNNVHGKKKKLFSLDDERQFDPNEKRGYWQQNADDDQTEVDDVDVESDASDHFWFCIVCHDGGDLLLCDTCPNSYHLDCLGLESAPSERWSCSGCTGDFTAYHKPEKQNIFCKVCEISGEVVQCDYCPSVYHKECVVPPLLQTPVKKWKCPDCMKSKTLRGGVSQILFWRWKSEFETSRADCPAGEINNNGNKEQSSDLEKSGVNVCSGRELLVSYKGRSYWDCEWVDDTALQYNHPLMYNNYFKTQWDLDNAPDVESDIEDDPNERQDLRKKYFQYGIKREWLEIERIIAHHGEMDDLDYLVKWCGLPYSACTWETLDDLPEGLQNFDYHLIKYWKHREEKRMTTDKRKPSRDLSLLRNEWEEQPIYVDNTGCKLHRYQLDGVNWLRFSYSHGTSTILADEMGLGKTIQAITFINSLWKEGYVSGPVLICVPRSTVPNWERELQLWAPDLYVVSYSGTRQDRTDARRYEFTYQEHRFPRIGKPSKLYPETVLKFDVLLTTYENLSRDKTTLSSLPWSLVVVDEAHKLKNQKALLHKVLSGYQIDYRLLMTGTPLQNSLQELFSLLHFMEPSHFENVTDFTEVFSDLSEEQQVSKIHEMLRPHLLRRTKADVVKDLPPKVEIVVPIKMTLTQKKVYKDILEKNHKALNAKGHPSRTNLQNIMMDLRKCCNHPYLFSAYEREATVISGNSFEGSELAAVSGKLQVLEKMLLICKRDGHRVLLFSQMTKMLDILQDFLDYKRYEFERIDGGITGDVRQEAIDRFNSPQSDSFVFLLSTRAGGLGINLATADTVIIYDMDWNPHNDIQALSRAHRLGQKNKVMIYRFMTKNSVEEKMTEACQEKMRLSDMVIDSGDLNHRNSSLGSTEYHLKIRDIIQFGADNLSDPKSNEVVEVVYSDAAVEKLMSREDKNSVQTNAADVIDLTASD